MQRTHHQSMLVFRFMLCVVLANYLAQIPYYLHLYYFPHGAPPSRSGTALLTLTLVWFLAGFAGTLRRWTAAYWVLVAYFVTVATFYLRNMLTQVTHGYPPFLHVWGEHDPILFVVFGIGYVNMLAALFFLYFLLRRHRSLLHTPPAAASGTPVR